MRVSGKVCVVTGGGSGIGKALCERFVAEGAKAVAVVDRNGPAAESVAQALGANAAAFACDVGAEAEVNDAIAGIESRFGPVGVLCNNAGIANDGDILTTPLGIWDQQWQVNVMAHVYAVRAVLPGMVARGEGIIQHTASMAVILTSHGACTYATTKHAVVGLAEWLSITYHDKGVRVFLLAPLGVNTPMLDTSSDFARTAAGPIREPEEVAQQVVDAFAEERFLVLTDPVAQTWMERKVADLERWLHGMRRMEARLSASRRP
jgi:NAD(P)-dependent dehydrogenase (short-subunit alcohol dehydrogenase family)